MNKIRSLLLSLISLTFSKTAKDTYFVFLGNMFSMFFAFLFTVVLVRIFSVSDFGYFSALWSFLLLVTDVADIGIGSSLSRFLPPMEKTKKALLSFLKTAFVLQFCVAAFFLTIIVLFSSLLSEILFHGQELNFILKIIAFGIFASILANFFVFALSARQKFLQVSILTSLGGLLRLLLLFTLIVLSKVTLQNVIFVQVATFLVLVFIAGRFVGWNFLFIKRTSGDFKKLISFSYYLGIARGLTAVAGKLDVLMLIAFTNSIETGIYATASRVIAVYPLLSGSFSTVIAPKIASLTSTVELKKFILKVILATFGLIATILVLIVFADVFMVTLFGTKSIPSVSVFRLLLFGMIFFVGSIPSVTLAIYYLKKPQILTINSIVQVAIVMVGNLFFIPRFGRFGAAYSLILAYGITLMTTSFLSYIIYKKQHE